jgi:hypothetical protein
MSKKDPKVEQVVVTAEQQIAEIGLQNLLNISITRALTLEEVRMLEIYSKVARVARGEATEVLSAQYKLIEQQKRDSIPEATLIDLASKLEDQKHELQNNASEEDK